MGSWPHSASEGLDYGHSARVVVDLPREKEMRKMRQQVEETSRNAVLVEDAHIRPMMGFEILEPVPTRSVPYERLDPFILVHESRLRLSDLKDVDTKHPHRGFDNLWYILEGTASTGHSTGPGGTIER